MEIMGKLTDVELRNWIKAGQPVTKTDGDGLTFTLSAKGTAAWTLRYRFGGKRKELTLGRYPELSLAAARRMADAERDRVAIGWDVAAEKAAARSAKGRRDHLAMMDRELAACASAIETIRARLEAVRAELHRQEERGNHGQAD
jgi:hypothetical protein